jgi:hypothetical protein
MSLRCSIFGHDYGDPGVEREREEEGSEVVITIRETETCQRCGAVQVVSENKEVTTVETAADIVSDDLADASDTAETEQAPGGGIPDAERDAESPAAESTTETAKTSQMSPEPASGDDAVILEEDDEDRGPGEWPDEKEAEPAESQQSAQSGDSDPEPAEWPDEPGDDGDEWAPQTEPETDEGLTVERTESAVTVPEGEFRCPECGFTTAVEASSLRAGDFCPDCHKGALEHHLEQ